MRGSGVESVGLGNHLGPDGEVYPLSIPRPFSFRSFVRLFSLDT